MRKVLGVVFTAVIGFSVSALAAQPSQRVRGTVEAIHGNTVTVQSYSGKKKTRVMLQSGTKYVWVVPANLSDIHPGTFIGTAATGPKNNLKAEEVVIFPDSMRGVGEGHYKWSMPAAVVQNDEGSGKKPAMTNGTMTNGTMSNGTMTNGTMTNGTMTNGTAAANGRKLTVTYHGQKVQVTVPTSAPVVRFVPAQRSALSHGSKVFVIASHAKGMLDAQLVAVGQNGLMPPM